MLFSFNTVEPGSVPIFFLMVNSLKGRVLFNESLQSGGRKHLRSLATDHGYTDTDMHNVHSHLPTDKLRLWGAKESTE